MTRRISRRTALQLLGATAAGAAMPWLRSPSARAQSTDVPLRILFIEAGNGCRRTTFEPSGMASRYVTQSTVESAWQFRDVMSALSPYRSRATMFQNLDMLSAAEDRSSPENAHIGGLTHMLTADSRYQGSSNLGGGPSIDQLIAQRLIENGTRTRLPSLELMATPDAGEWARSQNHDSYSAPGQKVPFITYVPDAWDRLFPTPLTGNNQEAARASARSAAVYNFVRGDYDRLLGKVSGEDRQKLTQMRDYRAELQAAVSVTSDREANRPAQSSIISPWSQLREGYQTGSPSNPTWRVHCELMSRLAAAALHTDTTRVVNLSFSVPPNYEYGYNNGDFGSADGHDLDHLVSGDSPTLTDPAAAAVLGQSHAAVYRQVAFMLDQLAALSETDGKSLLDHTIVVLYSHIAEGSHDLTRLPWVVFGDAQGYLRTGQYIRFPALNARSGQPLSPNDASTSYQWEARGRAHNDLFVTLANAMGVNISTFGNDSICRGPITEMLA